MKRALSAAGQRLWVTDVPGPHLASLWAALGEQQPLTAATLGGVRWPGETDVQHEQNPYSIVPLSRQPIRDLYQLIQSRPRAVVLDGWTSPAFLAARWWSRRSGIPVIASYPGAQSVHDPTSRRLTAIGCWFFHGVDVVLSSGRDRLGDSIGRSA